MRHVVKRDSNFNPKEISFLKKAFDKIAYPIAIIVPLSSMDQVLQIWQQKSAAGVSIVIWSMLFLTSIFWMFYGVIHKERVIFYGHVAWFILSSIILIEIIIFS